MSKAVNKVGMICTIGGCVAIGYTIAAVGLWHATEFVTFATGMSGPRLGCWVAGGGLIMVLAGIIMEELAWRS